MKRINIFVDESDLTYLNELPESFSEHIRRAIKDYIAKIRGINASTSVSKGGVDNHE